MKIRKNSGFDFEISNEDLNLIRRAIRAWKPSFNRFKYDGGNLFDSIKQWTDFIESDWENWDFSEYNHEIGCRYWIQLAIENASVDTAKKLEKIIDPIDDLYRNKMLPIKSHYLIKKKKSIFKNDRYFWETHTIHPELVK